MLDVNESVLSCVVVTVDDESFTVGAIHHQKSKKCTAGQLAVRQRFTLAA